MSTTNSRKPRSTRSTTRASRSTASATKSAALPAAAALSPPRWFANLNRAQALLGRSFFEITDDTRLNRDRWTYAEDSTLNAILSHELPILRKRARYETVNNPIAEGMIRTLVTDLVGANGPTLQIETGVGSLNDTAEEIWHDWWQSPDVNGQMSGVDLLSLAIRQLWTSGEWLLQKVNSTRQANSEYNPSGLTLRVLAIEPARLETPYNSSYDPRIVLGVERDRNGRPIGYWVNSVDPTEWTFNTLGGLSGTTTRYRADAIMHGFEVLEAGQARGVPWIAAALHPLSQLRDYEHEVMIAARAAARLSVLLQATGESAEFLPVSESIETEVGSITTMPPGWSALQLDSKQPQANYEQFTKQQRRLAGRPIGMPGMMVDLDSSGHNYSSARFDGGLYQRQIQKWRGWIARSLLNKLAFEVMREAWLMQMLGRPTQRAGNGMPRMRFRWNWPQFPHVDPLKEANAAQARLTAGISTLDDELQAAGLDLDTVVAKHRRVIDAFLGADLALPPIIVQPVNPLESPSGSSDNDADEQEVGDDAEDNA